MAKRISNWLRISSQTVVISGVSPCAQTGLRDCLYSCFFQDMASLLTCVNCCPWTPAQALIAFVRAFVSKYYCAGVSQDIWGFVQTGCLQMNANQSKSTLLGRDEMHCWGLSLPSETAWPASHSSGGLSVRTQFGIVRHHGYMAHCAFNPSQASCCCYL